MTNLQIAYQQLLETQRANRAKEALTQQQVAVAESEAQSKAREVAARVKETEAKLPLYQSQVLDTLKSAEFKNSQMAKIAAEIPKLAADTNLSEKQADKVVQETGRVIVQTALDAAQKEKILTEVGNLLQQRKKTDAEIAKIEQDTALSKTQRVNQKQQAIQRFVETLTQAKDSIVGSFKMDPQMAKALLGEIGF